MKGLDDFVAGPAFAVVVAGCWTVVVATLAYLLGKSDGYNDGLCEGRRRYLHDVQDELRRRSPIRRAVGPHRPGRMA